MRLTPEEQGWLRGEDGPGLARAMEILAALGRIFEAPDLVPVASVQVSGISYGNIGEPGLELLRDWADQGARVRVPAYMNPGGLDRELWERLGVPREFHSRQLEVIHALQRMGVEPVLSCTPYHVHPPPEAGDHLAWAESSAVTYANSVLGARTNREGGPSALAAAIAGRTPRHGLHTDEGRQAGVRMVLKADLPAETAAFGALGAWIGRHAGGRVVLVQGLAPPPESRRIACLKALGAAMAASGSVALAHVAGVTPEALDPGCLPLRPDAETMEVGDLSVEAGRIGTGEAGPVDLVALGCPHLALEDLRSLASRLAGRRLRASLWLTTSHHVRESARAEGLEGPLRDAGALVVADTCVVVAPLVEMGVRRVATDSAKAALYIPSHHGIPTLFGRTERCLRAAEEGRWTS